MPLAATYRGHSRRHLVTLSATLCTAAADGCWRLWLTPDSWCSETIFYIISLGTLVRNQLRSTSIARASSSHNLLAKPR